MKTLRKILGYQLQDVLRNKWLIAYALFFFVLSEALFRFGGSSDRVVLSLMNVILLLIPLMSALFGVMYLYSSREFIELMLTQPLSRKSIFAGLYAGLSLPLAAGFAFGAAIPFLLHGSHNTGQWGTLVTLLVSGVFLTLIFVGIAFVIALRYEDRVLGLGVSIFGWLALAVLYDGIVLLIVYAFNSYALEQPLIVLTLLNPIDLTRVLLLLSIDISALMGYTGAIFEAFFGGTGGMAIALLMLLVWTLFPIWLGRKQFIAKDF